MQQQLKKCVLVVLIQGVLLLSGPKISCAQDVFSLSIEELGEIEVTSASRKKQALSEVAAALYVINQQDIARSGATSIPELLRTVPGLHVARLNNHQWAISSRGFNTQFTDKLLVMIDGRTVYNPIFSGTYWNAQDTVLEDIERIEVIRGPGAAVWGANAVNGVINIITKSSKVTDGGLLVAGAGNEERGFATVRYGDQISKDTNLRVYAKGFDRDRSEQPDSTESHDAWQAVQGGFRLDSGDQNEGIFTLQGDVYGGNTERTLHIPTLQEPFVQSQRGDGPYGGANILGRYSKTWTTNLSSEIQTYYDRTYRDDGVADQSVETYDLDTTHTWIQSKKSDLIFGIGYRLIEDDIQPVSDLLVEFDPRSQSQHNINGFLQQDLKLLDNQILLSMGTKMEHSSVTGETFQPSLRALWKVDPSSSLWLASSRVKRSPSRIDRDIKFYFPGEQTDSGLIALGLIDGNKNFSGESAYVQELGYRLTPNENLSFDVASFYSHYDRVRSIEPTETSISATENGQPFIAVGNIFDTQRSVDSYGFEFLVTNQINSWWQLKGWYSFIKLITDDSSSLNTLVGPENEDLPQQQAYLRNSLDLSTSTVFDIQARFVDQLATGVDSYLAFDARVAWAPMHSLELSLVGQNLFDSAHQEFDDTFNAASGAQLERSFYGQIKYLF